MNSFVKLLPGDSEAESLFSCNLGLAGAVFSDMGDMVVSFRTLPASLIEFVAEAGGDLDDLECGEEDRFVDRGDLEAITFGLRLRLRM